MCKIRFCLRICKLVHLIDSLLKNTLGKNQEGADSGPLIRAKDSEIDGGEEFSETDQKVLKRKKR